MKKILNTLIISLLILSFGEINAQESIPKETKELLDKVDLLISEGDFTTVQALLNPIVDSLKSEALTAPTKEHREIWLRWSKVTYNWFSTLEQEKHSEGLIAPRELILISELLQPFDLFSYTDSWLDFLLKGTLYKDAAIVEEGTQKVDSLLSIVRKEKKLGERELSILEAKYLGARQIYYFSTNVLDSALYFADKSIEICKNWEENLSEDLARAYFIKGHTLIRLNREQEGLDHFHLAMPIVEKLFSTNYWGLTQIYQRIYYHSASIKIRNFADGLAYAEKYANLVKSHKGEMEEGLPSVYYEMARCNQFMNRHIEAAEVLKFAAANAEFNDGPQSPSLAFYYNRIGDCYSYGSKTIEAMQYFELAENIYKSHGDQFSNELAMLYITMGIADIKSKRYDDAIVYLKQAELYFLSDQKKRNWQYNSGLAETYRCLSGAFRMNGQMDSSAIYIEKPLQYAAATDYITLINCHTERGSFFTATGDWEEALKNYSKVLEFFANPAHTGFKDSASIYRYMGNVYMQKKDYQNSIVNLKKSIDLLLPQKRYINSLVPATTLGLVYNAMGEYDKAIEHLEKFYFEYFPKIGDPNTYDGNTADLLLHLLGEYEKSLFFRYERDKNPEDLALANQYAQKCLDIFQFYRKYISEEKTREFYTHKHGFVFEHNLKLAYQQYQISQNPAIIDSALKTMETAKSFNLLASFRTKGAAELSAIPVNFLEEEERLKSEIQNLLSKKSEVKMNPQTQEGSIASLDSLIFEKNKTHNKFLDQLHDKYPSYFNLKYNSQTVSISEIQKEILQEDEMLIQYTLIETEDSLSGASNFSQSELVILAISSSEVFYKPMPIDNSFNENFFDYLKALSSNRPSDSFLQASGEKMYNLLLKEPLEAFKAKPKKLIIIPDGKLNYLPFEALPIPNAPADAPWLIHHMACSYAYSATLLQQQMQMKPKSPAQFFASFAADYQDFEVEADKAFEDSLFATVVRSGKFVLPFAAAEAQAIAEIMEGKSFQGSEASEKNFKEKASDYQIIHLALHAFINDQEPMLSELVFTPTTDSIEDGFLTAAEIYHMNLNAELAVLSACNTGYGKIQPGEGVKSLSRAMSYVGVPSTVMSLWKVPDQSTSEIMQAFYRYLKEGMEKDEALRQAKLDYLNNSVENDQRLPFYWAGFVANGNMKSISPHNTLGWLWMLILAVVILGGGYFAYRSFSNSRANL